MQPSSSSPQAGKTGVQSSLLEVKKENVARRVFLVSRISSFLPIPMLFVMAVASDYLMFKR
jgi:hypothetical protein